MKDHILEMCCQKQHQGNLKLIEKICQAERSEINACLLQEDCTKWFLRSTAFHRYDNDELLFKRILAHPNCPDDVIALVKYFLPKLLKDSPAFAAIQLYCTGTRYKSEWNKKVKLYEDSSFVLNDLILLIYETFIRKSPDDIRNKDGALKPIFSEILERTPYFVIKRYFKSTENSKPSWEIDKGRRLKIEGNILKLSCEEKHQGNLKLVESIYQADRAEVDACLLQEDCTEWFIRSAAFHRHDNDELLFKRILAHPNCPDDVVAVIKCFLPALLEETPALAVFQLNCMDPQYKEKWDRKIRVFKSSNLLHDVIRRIYENFIHKSSRNIVDIDRPYKSIYSELLERTPYFILAQYFKDTKSTKFIGSTISTDFAIKNYKSLATQSKTELAKRWPLTAQLSELLITEKSIGVKKALAENSTTPYLIVKRLAEDPNEKISSLALNNLPIDTRDSIVVESAETQGYDRKKALINLRFEQINPAELERIAKIGEPFIACAASLHKDSNNSTIETIIKREDLPDWAKIGAALKSNNHVFLDKMIDLGDDDFNVALSDNPYLDENQAAKLIDQTQRDRVLANLANHFIENSKLLSNIAASTKVKSQWIKNLRRILDPNVKNSELRSIAKNDECTYLILARLLARNPNCPKHLFKRFAHYLPEDLLLNPGYSLLLLEDPSAKERRGFDDWKVEEFIEYSGPEYVVDSMSSTSDKKLARKLGSSRTINPNHIRLYAISDDAALQRRLVHERAQRFSEFEYRSLAELGSATTLKALLKVPHISNEVVLYLSSVKDKSVAITAEKIAKKRGLAVEKVVKEISLKGLGNKSARMDFARESLDLNILKLLVKDKTKDVRMTVASREELDNESLLILTEDKEDGVITSLKRNLNKRKFSDEQKNTLTQVAQRVVSDVSRSISARQSMLEFITDQDFLKSLYKDPKGELEIKIIELTRDEELMETVLFNYNRQNDNKNDRVLQSLSNNPYLSLSIARKLLLENSRYSKNIISRNSNPEVIALIFNDHPCVKNERIYIKQRFCESDLLYLFDNMNNEQYFHWYGKQLHKIADNRLIEIIRAQKNEESLVYVASNREISSIVFDELCQISDERSYYQLQECLLSGGSIPNTYKTLWYNSHNKNVRSALAATQSLTKEQIDGYIKNENLDVISSLFESPYVSMDSFPDKLLKRFASDSDYWNAQKKSKQALKKREDYIELGNNPLPLAEILRRTETQLTTPKFLKKFREAGFAEQQQKCLESGKEATVDILTELGKSYGVNGEIYERYKIMYYPYTFLDLMKILD